MKIFHKTNRMYHKFNNNRDIHASFFFVFSMYEGPVAEFLEPNKRTIRKDVLIIAVKTCAKLITYFRRSESRTTAHIVLQAP